MINFLHSIRQWLEIALIIAIAGFLFIHFLLPKTPRTVTLPGGQVINLDTKSFNASVKQILKKVDDQGKKVNDMESQIRQQQIHTVEQEIPAALKETSIARSVATMKEAW